MGKVYIGLSKRYLYDPQMCPQSVELNKIIKILTSYFDFSFFLTFDKSKELTFVWYERKFPSNRILPL